MKQILILSVGLLLAVSCRLTDKDGDGQITSDLIKNPHATNTSAEDLASLTFLHQKINFGELVQGERFDTTIFFTNTGSSPMLIESVQGSCGCTVAKNWPKTPVNPGEQGSFSVTFNSEGKEGQQHKSITVVANTSPATNIVVLHGNIIVPNTHK
jgi:hypothetical protein